MISFNPRPACFMFLMAAMAVPAFAQPEPLPEALPAPLPMALAERAASSGATLTSSSDGAAAGSMAMKIVKPCANIPVTVYGPDGNPFEVMVPCKEPGAVTGAAQKAIGGWDSMAFLASLVAFLAALMRVLKMTPVEDYLDEHDLKWVKPAASAFIGAILGAVGAYQLGTPPMIGFVGGFMSGLTAVGGHEVMNPRKPPKEVPPTPPATPPAPSA